MKTCIQLCLEQVIKSNTSSLDRNANGSKVIEKLVTMMDPPIIGYDHVKEGLLLCTANTGEDINNSNSKRMRINALLVGTFWSKFAGLI